ncbi:MAG: SPOR domain-containing protein [Betaproteobacteria bacterium]
MAQPVTDDELQLRKRARRRLVGAIVLVLLVVVFLPMALDNKPRPLSKNVDIQVPALDSAENKFPAAAPPPASQSAVPQEAPTEAKSADDVSVSPPPATASPTPVPEPAPAVPPAEPEKKAEPAKQVELSKPAPSVKEPRREPPKAATALESEGYVIQLGAFSDAANAKQLHQRLRAARMPAYLEPIKTPQGQKTRVRVGPFASEDAAEKARQRLLKLALSKGDLKIVKQGE